MTFWGSLKSSPRLSIVHLPQIPVLQCLYLEEAIFRLSRQTAHAWLFFNDYTQLRNGVRRRGQSDGYFQSGSIVVNGKDGSECEPSIVLGSSTRNPGELVRTRNVAEDGVELVRRFTVSVCLFVIGATFRRVFVS